ncbi:MAG: tetratricopeptide repeat protein [Lachnospiraceae bacterium]|nr:tetratricopeptide repeat protein [Lachnospiraceae bacterium]
MNIKKAMLHICLIAILLLLPGCSILDGGGSAAHLGMQAIEEGDYDKALEIFEGAEKGSANKELLYRGRGIALMGKSDYKGAVAAFKEALSHAPGRIRDLEYDISFYLAVAEFRSGNAEAAKDTCSAILDLDRKNSNAFFLRGKAELSTGDTDHALRDFAAAIRFNSEDPDLYIDIYESLTAADMADDGESYLKSAMELTKLSDFQKGKLAYWMEDYERAKQALEGSRGDDSDPAVILYLGRTYEALGDKSYAASLYKTYLKDNPGDVGICNQLGLCELDVGDYGSALKAFEQGLSNGGGNIVQSLKFNQIVAYEYLSDFKKATVLMEAYLKDYPDDEVAKREYAFLSTR